MCRWWTDVCGEVEDWKRPVESIKESVVKEGKYYMEAVVHE